MLEPKYQVRLELVELGTENIVEATFARPIEVSIFAAIKAAFTPYNFTVTYGTNLVVGGRDTHQVEVHYDDSYKSKDVMREFVELLKNEGFTSFFFTRSIIGGKREGTDIESILG